MKIKTKSINFLDNYYDVFYFLLPHKFGYNSKLIVVIAQRMPDLVVKTNIELFKHLDSGKF